MAVFTKLNHKDFSKIESYFDLGKILKFRGIKKGIENTNYFIEFEKKISRSISKVWKI